MKDPYSHLAEHQRTALKKLSNGKVLYGGVGTGKSRVAATYYRDKEAPKHVYVITTAKKRDSFDWQETFYALGIGPRSGPPAPPGLLPKGHRRKSRGPAAGLGEGRLGRDAELESVQGQEVLLRGLRHRDGSISEDPLVQGAGGAVPGGVDGIHPRTDLLEHGSSDGGNGGAGGREAEADRRGTVPNATAIQERVSPHGRNGRRLTVSFSSSSPDLLQHGSGGTGNGGQGKLQECFPGSSGLDPQSRDAGLEADHAGGHTEPGDGSVLQGQSSDTDQASGHQLGAVGGVFPWVVTVDSWNNINKYAGVEDAFFIFDEQRLVGSGLWAKAFLRIARRNNWILLSGTPGDTWMDYVPLFVANGFYKNRSEFKREHVVYNTFTKFPKVDRYINVGRLVRQRASLLVEMPYVRHTRRRHVQVELPYDKEALDLVLRQRWHIYEDRPLRDVGEMMSVARKLVNSDPSRLEMTYELWKKHRKLIVFYNFDYELEILRTLNGTYMPKQAEDDQGLKDGSLRPSAKSSSGPSPAPSTWSSSTSKKKSTESLTSGRRISSTESSTLADGDSGTRELRSIPLRDVDITQIDSSSMNGPPAEYEIAEWNGHKHQPLPTGDTWIYLVQYVAGAEAWECVTTDAITFYSRNYSWKIWEQAQGRIDRLNTLFTDLWYYNFTSDSFIDKAIERSMDAKESFNENVFAGMFRG